MTKRFQAIGISFLMAMTIAATAPRSLAGTSERYLHIKVDDGTKGESVNVNVPISMAEKILPAVSHGNLHEGRVTIGRTDMDNVDIRALLDAVRSAPDNEFVTVKEKDQEIRLAKSKGNLLVHVRDTSSKSSEEEKVDITIPIKIVDALLSTAKQNELDITAALQALSDAGDTLLVTVQDASQHVRIWVDSKSASE
jgi:hypothetical protein